MADHLRAIAFDCYGTLVDFADRGFIQAYDEVCRLQELPIDGQALWDKWMELWQRLAQSGDARESPPNGPMLVEARPLSGPLPPFRPYREEWPEHFEKAFAELGVRGDTQAAYHHVRRRLAEAAAFPEARQVIGALRGRYRVAILSNADDDFLLPCLERNGLHADLVVSSEGARVYKPHEAIFRRVADGLGADLGQVLYVGDSHFSDVLGAKRAGMPMAWVNPSGRPLPDGVPPPDYELRSLDEVLSLPFLSLEEG